MGKSGLKLLRKYETGTRDFSPQFMTMEKELTPKISGKFLIHFLQWENEGGLGWD